MKPHLIDYQYKCKFPLETELEICVRYGEGASLNALGKQYAINPQTVANILERHGIPRRNRGATKKTFSRDAIDEMVRLYNDGLSQESIARRFDTNQRYVSDILRKEGVKTRKAWDQHPRWNGGRTINNQGYVFIKISNDDPLVSMRGTNGYAQEHRIVMARYLGRPLLDSETVHHIDEDKANNDISNLQLRIGKHGKGAAYCCADCGSLRLNPIELKEPDYGQEITTETLAKAA